MLRGLLREPLVYFLLMGAALFALTDATGNAARHIVVTSAEQARLADQWQTQMGRPPTATELEGLVEQWLREEIYYREAVAMGLADGDVIVRRRLAQKLAFLTEDLASGAPAAEDVLRDYHRRHSQRYVDPARFSFVHRYFSSEARQDAEGDARHALTVLNADEAAGDPAEGDVFMLQRSYLERTRRDIGELFGREFATAVAELPVGRWQGPVPSAYGWHLVRVDQQRPQRALTFKEVSAQVAADHRQEQRRRGNDAFYASLRERYQIVRP